MSQEICSALHFSHGLFVFLQSITNSPSIMIERNTYMSALYRWKDKQVLKISLIFDVLYFGADVLSV